MANLTTTVRDSEGRKLFQLTGRVPAQEALDAAERHAEFLAKALEDRKHWSVSTQRGSVPAQTYEELHG